MIGLLAAHHIGLVQILMICVPSTLIAVFVASLVTKAPVAEVPRCKTCQSGVTAIVGILGLAWLGDTFINANRKAIIGGPEYNGDRSAVDLRIRLVLCVRAPLQPGRNRTRPHAARPFS